MAVGSERPGSSLADETSDAIAFHHSKGVPHATRSLVQDSAGHDQEAQSMLQRGATRKSRK